MSHLFGTHIDVDELRKQPQFSLAMRLYGYWIETSDRKLGKHSQAARNVAAAGIEDDTWSVALLTLTTITRRYRSIVELCARGEASDGDVLCRSLYEAFLKLAFVVLPHLPFKR